MTTAEGELVRVRIDELEPYPGNYNVHPDEQLDELARSLENFSQYKNIVIWNGKILAGHGPVEAAEKKLGWEAVEARDMSHLSQEEAEALLMADNETPRGAEPDPELLLTILQRQKDPLSVPGIGQTYYEQLIQQVQNGDGNLPENAPADAEPKLDEAQKLREEWNTQPGQLWHIASTTEAGTHRLFCADATEPAAVQLLFEDRKAAIIVTDPPYGVEYVGKTADALTIQNDEVDDEKTRALVRDFLSAAPLRPGGSFYIFSPAGNTETAFRLGIMDAGLELRQCIVWVKDVFVMGRQDYHWRHESILYGWAGGAAHYFVDDRTQDTVWEVDRPKRSRLHPTTKPVELVERALANSSRRGELVFDGFVGSGTALSAAERTGRLCYAIDKDPKYLAVSLQRLEDMGLEPELAEEYDPLEVGYTEEELEAYG